MKYFSYFDRYRYVWINIIVFVINGTLWQQICYRLNLIFWKVMVKGVVELILVGGF